MFRAQHLGIKGSEIGVGGGGGGGVQEPESESPLQFTTKLALEKLKDDM